MFECRFHEIIQTLVTSNFFSSYPVGVNAVLPVGYTQSENVGVILFDRDVDSTVTSMHIFLYNLAWCL